MNTNKLYYTFDELKLDLHSIVKKIEVDKWIPDIIIGPCRGAYIPGVMLSHHFKKPFEGFVWQTRDGTKKDLNKLEEIIKENKGKKVLLIDDINDSGLTLTAIVNEINKVDPSINLKTCVIFSKTQSRFSSVDYFSKQLTPENNPWVVFPYEEW